MSINHISNKLHQAFPKVKNASLIVFILAFSLITLKSTYVYGEADKPTFLTKITVNYDNQNKTYRTTGANVLEALNEGGINVANNDITSPTLDTKLTGKDLSVNLIRALPVVVSDNNQEQLAFSAYSEPKEILKQLNIETFPEDKVNAELIMDPVDEGAAGQKITISRAPVYSVSVDGEVKIIRSWGQTVSSVISGQIPLGQKDIVEPNVDSVAPTDGKITITRVNVAEVEVTENIPFNTTYKDDYTMYKGRTKVEQEGQNGSKKMKYQITYHNGVEVGRAVLSSDVLSEPKTKVIVRGLKPIDAGAYWDTLVAAGTKYGVDPSAMYRVMMCESGGNASAGSAYKGLFQWDGSFYNWATKAGFPGANIYDPTAQIYATALRVSQQGWSAWGCKP